jgi:hypothetical protein
MRTNTLLDSIPQAGIPLRAIVEIIGGELKIYPLAESDAEEHQILNAFRFIREDLGR